MIFFGTKLKKSVQSRIELFLQVVQTIVAVVGLAVVIYGLFLSDISELIEAELRSSLTTAQYDNLQLKKERDFLNKELGEAKSSLERELAAVAEVDKKKKALELELWRRVGGVFFATCKVGSIDIKLKTNGPRRPCRISNGYSRMQESLRMVFY